MCELKDNKVNNMQDLQEIRQQIDSIDQELVALFQERMKCAR